MRREEKRREKKRKEKKRKEERKPNAETQRVQSSTEERKISPQSSQRRAEVTEKERLADGWCHDPSTTASKRRWPPVRMTGG